MTFARLDRLSTRELLLATMVAVLALTYPSLKYGLLPAWDRWSVARQASERNAAELARLSHNLTIRDAVQRRFLELPAELWQTQSQAVTLSRLLGGVELAASRTGVSMTNMRPGDPLKAEAFVSYPLRVSVAGPLPAMLAFVSDITAGGDTATESISMRALPAAGMVECTVVLRVVRLIGANPEGGARARR